MHAGMEGGGGDETGEEKEDLEKLRIQRERKKKTKYREHKYDKKICGEGENKEFEKLRRRKRRRCRGLLMINEEKVHREMRNEKRLGKFKDLREDKIIRERRVKGSSEWKNVINIQGNWREVRGRIREG